MRPIRGGRNWRSLVVVLGLVCAAGLVWAQTPGRRATVTTKQGDSIEGMFVSADQRQVVLQVGSQRVTLPLDDVAVISFAGGGQPAAGAPVARGEQPAVGAPAGRVEHPAAAPVTRGARVPLMDSAFEAFGEIEAATDKGVRREQYPDLLRTTIPRIEAFVKSPGHSFADVRLLMTAALNDYVQPFGAGLLITRATLWTSSSPLWRDAAARIAYARELAAQPGEESHREKPAERDLPASAQVVGRLGSGDRVMPEAVDRSTAGAFNDVYRLTIDKPTKVSLTLETRQCAAHLTLTDEAGKSIASSGRTGESARITKDLKPGVYNVWAGTNRPDEVGTYRLAVAAR